MEKSWTTLGEILEKFAHFSSLQQGSGGVGEVRLRLRTKAKAKDKAKAINQQSRLTPRVGSAELNKEQLK